MAFHVPNHLRIRSGPMGSDNSVGNAGAFSKGQLRIIASNAGGWEHVSVSLDYRCPTWSEMCHVKSLFWDAEDCVVQFHPPESEYVNAHPYCLHLWRSIGTQIQTPPTYMIGPLK